MSADWQIGDLALCVNDRPSPFFPTVACRLRSGAIYTVRGVGIDEGGQLGLFLEEVRSYGMKGGFVSSRFRKIRPHTPDAEDAETIRLLNGLPVREPVA